MLVGNFVTGDNGAGASDCADDEAEGGDGDEVSNVGCVAGLVVEGIGEGAHFDDECSEQHNDGDD